MNDPEWQELRKSFLGTWKHSPVQNIHKLREYLGDFTDYLKLRRVLNYLTGSGFRSGKIKHSKINELRIKVKNKLKTHG